MKFSSDDLKRLQALPLEDKIALSQCRISEWYEHWGGKVSISFSGGKDSTVLLHLVRSMYPDVPAVYVNSGLDLPDVLTFIKQTPNVVFLKPQLNFRQVINTYGWVFPNKNVAHYIEGARQGKRFGLMGLDGKLADGTPSPFNRDRLCHWKYLLDAPFKISPKCCEIMKEKPLALYQKQTGLMPFIALMATESHRRQMAWLKTGCNAFNTKHPSSRPLMFWTEQDVLAYIKARALPIAEAYGKIVEVNGKLQTTDEQRTGCAFCIVGAHLDKGKRFRRLKDKFPALYKYCMEQLCLHEVLTWLNIPH